MQMAEAKQIFKEHGIRYTGRRKAVYESLLGTRSHPTVDELQAMVCESGCEVSTATMYNTLALFCRSGLARRLPIPGGADRYDADTTDHLHLRLDDLGEVHDVPDDLAAALFSVMDSKILEQIESRMGISVDRVGLHLIGHRDADA